jgi:hypothetical protein
MEGAMGGMCSTLRNNENTLSTLVGKPERKRPLGGPRRRWEYNIKTGLTEGALDVMVIWLGTGASGWLLYEH